LFGWKIFDYGNERMLSYAHRRVIALLLCLVVWLGWRMSSESTQQSSQQQSSPQPQAEPPKVSTDERIADYTLALAVLTGVLAGSTLLLWWQTRKSTRISERALTELERAYIFVTPVPSIEEGRTIVSLKIDNAGQTPGFVHEGYGTTSVSEPTGEPSYPPQKNNPRVLEALVRKDATEIFPTKWWSPITEPHYFYGYIKYTDIFQKEHTSRVCVKIFPAEGKLDLAGPPAWNEWD
jgi:hypothetical protein